MLIKRLWLSAELDDTLTVLGQGNIWNMDQDCRTLI